MKPELFVSEVSPESGRGAVLDGEGPACWLYLTEPESTRPVADVWVMNQIAAPTVQEIKAFRGQAPPAPREMIEAAAHRPSPGDHRWTFEWHRGGHAVVLLRDGLPWAALSSGRPRGVSRHLVKGGAFGEPWSDAWLKQWVRDAR